MEVEVLSHACLLIRTKSSSVIIDPWLLGSCYWRSWWNFPPAQFDESKLGQVDAVVISHIHWDHWHGPTLRRFFQGKRIYVPNEPGGKSERDLLAMGFLDVVRLPHARSVEIGDLRLTMYQFGLLLNDAAVVLEANGVAILNANDAKIAGLSLLHLMRKHGPFKLAFRSHSSANRRICSQIEGHSHLVQDDREHYFRSFVAFMDVVRPAFAIPFASNHCHLHPDVFEFNAYISNPLQLREYVGKTPRQMGWELQVMLPGSRWSPESGFSLTDERVFDDLNNSLIAYRESQEPKLAASLEAERRVQISLELIGRFLTMIRGSRMPWTRFNRFLLTITRPGCAGRTFRVEPELNRVQEVGFLESSECGWPMYRVPARVFRDAVRMNMFHHAGISKRCRMIARSAEDLASLERMIRALEWRELGLFPLSFSYVARLLGGYGRRWRELCVYAHALWLRVVRRVPMYLVEEEVLRSTKRGDRP